MKNILQLSCVLLLTTTYNALADELPSDARIACDKSGKECVAVGTVGVDCFNCNQPVAFVSHDAQQTWQQTERMDVGDSTNSINSIVCSKDDVKNCVVFGYYVISHDRPEFFDVLVLTSHDVGKSWSKQMFGCPMMSFSNASINDYYCNSSVDHCVAVGTCTKGMGDDRIYPMVIYLKNPGWAWSNGIGKNINYIKFTKVTCTEENDNINCKADADASDDGHKWWKISAITKDNGENWTYIDSKLKLYLGAFSTP